jgi:aconitate decarboxylase
MNIGYTLAVALIDGAALVPQFAPSRINADDVWKLLPRISVRHEPSFDNLGPARRGRVKMEITFTDGQRIVTERNASRAIESPYDNDEVAAKFRSLTTGLIDPDRQAQIETMVRSLEKLDDMRELMALLGPACKAAFE